MDITAMFVIKPDGIQTYSIIERFNKTEFGLNLGLN